MGRFSSVIKVFSILAIVVLSLGSSFAQDESVLVLAFEQEAPNLAPLNSLVYGQLPENFYGRDLWHWDETRTVFAVLAAEIPSTDNGGVAATADGDTAVTVHLREGLQWSDGTPITSADCEVLHTIRTDSSTSTNFARGQYPDVVKSFEVVDDLTFIVTYNGTFPDAVVSNERPQCQYPGHLFSEMIADGGILEDSDYFTGNGSFPLGDTGETVATVGYGPYALAEWNIGESMVMVRNPLWQDEAPQWDRIIISFITDDTQMRNALDAGEVDLTFGWSDDLQSEYSGIDGVNTFAAPGVFTDALWLRIGENGVTEGTASSAMLDPAVRQAIAHAIDRVTLAEQLIGPGIQVPTSWYPQTLWPDDLPFLDYNVDAAVELLTQAGWVDSNDDGTVDKDGIELDGLRFVTTENTLRNNYQLVIQEYLAEVGIGVDIQIIPATVLFASYSDRGTLTNYEWDLAIFANSAKPLEPTTDTDSYTCSAIPSDENPDGFNPWQFCDEVYDAQDAQIAGTLPGAERDALIADNVRRHYGAYFWHGLRLRATWFAVSGSALDPDSVEANVGTLASNWFNQVEYWTPGG